MQEHYERMRRGDPALRLIAGSPDDRLAGLGPLFELEPGFSVLDIGCHDGYILQKLAVAGAGIIHGVDIHEPSLVVARDRLVGYEAVIEAVDLCTGFDGLRQTLPLLPGYDVVLFLGVYHHMVRQMGPAAVSAFVAELFPLVALRLAIRTPAKFMALLRTDAALEPFELIHRDDTNPAVSPLEIYAPIR